MARPTKYFSKQDLLRAMKHTKSIRAAANYLGCSYQHVKPYFKMYRVDDNDLSSPTLFEAHYNKDGKGIHKWNPSDRKNISIAKILEGGDGWQSFTAEKIKLRAIDEGYLVEACHRCGFAEHRVSDYKTPTLLTFKNNVKTDFRLENLQLLCYNCYYLYVGDVLSHADIKNVETHHESMKKKEEIWDIDDEMRENMKALGLWEEEGNEEDKFIASL